MNSHLQGEKIGPNYAVEVKHEGTKSVSWAGFKTKEDAIAYAKKIGMKAFENGKQIYP